MLSLVHVGILIFQGLFVRQVHALAYCHDAYVEIWNDCYDFYGVKLSPSDSYVVGSENFFRVCRDDNITALIECYENVIAKCPETYRENGPAMMDVRGFRAFLIGSCVNMQRFEKGKKCVQSKYKYGSFTDHVNKKCLPKSFFDSQWDAFIYDDWNTYCNTFDDGMKCMKEKVETYNCPEFTDFVWFSSYAQQPPMCRDNSPSKYAWVDMYQTMPSAATINEHFGIPHGIILFIACFCCLIY